MQQKGTPLGVPFFIFNQQGFGIGAKFLEVIYRSVFVVIRDVEEKSARYKPYRVYGILKGRRVIRITPDALNGSNT